MAMRTPFKPMDALTAADFGAYPLWGFDTSLEGAVEEADETWVRPYAYEDVPETSDVLFAAADVKAGGQPGHRGAVSFTFVGSKPAMDCCILLTPRHCSLPVPFSQAERWSLERILGKDFEAYFPVLYEAVVEVAGKRFTLSGTIVF